MEASPGPDDVRKEAKADVRYEADGSWVATVRGEENMRRAAAMMEGVNRADADLAAQVQARKPKERVLTKDGTMLEFPEHLVDQVKRKAGFRVPGRAGGSRIVMTGGWLPNARDRERMARGED